MDANKKLENLGIKKLLQAVRQELIESQEEREKKGLTPLFVVDNLKIEVNFVVEHAKGVTGGFDLKVVEVGGNLSYSSQQVHKITLELKACNEKRGSQSKSTELLQKAAYVHLPEGSKPAIEFPFEIEAPKGSAPCVIENPNPGRPFRPMHFHINPHRRSMYNGNSPRNNPD